MHEDDAGEPPPYEEDPDAPSVGKLSPFVRDVFAGNPGLTRGKLLNLFRSTMYVDHWRECLENVRENNPEATRDEVVEAVRQYNMGLYGRVADAAGLAPLEKASYLAAVRRGFDLAAGGGEGIPLEGPRFEPDPALVEEDAAWLRAAFDGTPEERAGWFDRNRAEHVRAIAEVRLLIQADRPDDYEDFLSRMRAVFVAIGAAARLSGPESEVYRAELQRIFRDAEGERLTNGGG